MAVILKQFNLVLEVKKMLRAKEIVLSEAVRYSPGSVPRVNYRAQFMNKILYFHKKLNVFHLA